ncbi:hypothetical protein QTP88_019974 [Uroleucon formosanum]
MKIKNYLEYSKFLDLIEGYEDLGTKERSNKLAGQALVFMIRGAYSKWKLPFAYFLPSTSINHKTLSELLIEAIYKIFDCGFIVLSMVYDQGTNNVSALQKDLNMTKDRPFIEIRGRKVFSIFDVPHLYKNLRNNFIKNNFIYKENETSFQDLKDTYELDKNSEDGNNSCSSSCSNLSLSSLSSIEVISEENDPPNVTLEDCYMLERLLDLRSAVVVIMSDRTLFNSKIAKDQELLEEDWEKIEIFVTLLKPLKTATTVLFADQNITISMIVDFQTLFKETIIHELSTRFTVQIDVDNDCEREISITQMASMLDPRYKNMSFESSENIKNRIKQIVRSKMVLLSRNTDVRIPTEKRTALDELLEEEPNNETDEFSRYMVEFQINHNADPCTWWKDYENIFPTLAILVKQILCIPASSASSERVFSTAKTQ